MDWLPRDWEGCQVKYTWMILMKYRLMHDWYYTVIHITWYDISHDAYVQEIVYLCVAWSLWIFDSFTPISRLIWLVHGLFWRHSFIDGNPGSTSIHNPKRKLVFQPQGYSTWHVQPTETFFFQIASSANPEPLRWRRRNHWGKGEDQKNQMRKHDFRRILFIYFIPVHIIYTLDIYIYIYAHIISIMYEYICIIKYIYIYIHISRHPSPHFPKVLRIQLN